MRKYETLLLVRPDLPEETMARLKERVLGLVQKNGAVEVCYQDWGKRKLAYSIDKSTKGNYLYVRYLDNGDAVREIERNLRVADEVLRYMSVRLEDDVDPATFDFEADRKGIWPLNARPREESPEGGERREREDTWAEETAMVRPAAAAAAPEPAADVVPVPAAEPDEHQ